MRFRTTFSVALIGMLMLVAAAPAWAGDDLVLAFTEGESEQEVVEEDPGSELGIEPAVPAAPAEEEEAADSPWTQRFLAPTVLALAGVGLIGALVYYGARVRGKYKVAQ